MIDIALIAVPVIDLTLSPPLAIYALKGMLNRHDITSKCFDLIKDSKEFLSVNDDIEHEILDWSTTKKVNTAIYDFYKEYIINKVKPTKPKWIGLSLFSCNSQYSADILCNIIREFIPNVKIVVGGFGLSDAFGGDSGFCDELISRNHIDYFIYGEGEYALPELLKGNETFSGINEYTYTQIDDLDVLPFPDYSDWVEEYGKPNQIIITGSRGCVRSCTYCDVATLWNKFRYRSGENIAMEIQHFMKMYGTMVFEFSDSLINGSMKAFRDLCQCMSDYRERTEYPENAVVWGGQFIVRSETQMTKNDFQLMKKAGMEWATLGIESGSEKIRNDMKKGFSNEDIYYTIDNLIKNGISMDLLFIFGYPTETEEDVQETMNVLKHYASKSVNNNTNNDEGKINEISIGTGLVVLENTPLETSIELFTGSGRYWKSKIVEGLDYQERYDRMIRLTDLAKKLGYNISRYENNIKMMKKRLKEEKY